MPRVLSAARWSVLSYKRGTSDGWCRARMDLTAAGLLVLITAAGVSRARGRCTVSSAPSSNFMLQSAL